MPGLNPSIQASPASSFRDGPKDQTRNLEIPRCAIAHLRFDAAHRPGMTGLGRVKPGHDVEAVSTSHGAIEIGEKSTNQLFGCTKPLTLALIARGATSCAT